MSATPETPAPAHVFVIAEAGVNHNGDPAMAADLVQAAADSGADSVKFQTFDPDALVAASTVTASYQKQATGIDDQREMLRGLVLPDAALRDLARQCDDLGIEFLSTPFDHGSADALAKLGVQRFKIGSGDVTNVPLLRHVASFGKPVILSTGMATIDEIDEAVEALDAVRERLTILHCVSAYPTPMAQANLLAIRTLQARFGGIIGYSDHTLGGTASLAAVALGATAIEKHLTLDCRLPGPDHRASLEPAPFREMVEGIRDVSASLGDGTKRPQPEEIETRQVARRGVKLTRDLPEGHVLMTDDLAVLRPETGLHPRHMPELVGRKLSAAAKAGHPLDWPDLGE
jgi:N,N'-diacetyllegionaminate synthase